MKQESKDINVILSLTENEIELLQKNTGDMADSFGLDDRINSLEGESQIGLNSGDLECMEMVIGDLKNDTEAEKIIANALYVKIIEAIEFIEQSR